MNNRVWILGAPDPEMAAIESLLRECGEHVEYALDNRGERVTPATAYRCPLPEVAVGSPVYAVECIDVLPKGWVRIDHHRPGDPGYGRPPAEYLTASSIGQVISVLLAVYYHQMPPMALAGTDSASALHWTQLGALAWCSWYPVSDCFIVNDWVRYTAAADHCLGAAYRGECPGVDPDALMRWRAEGRCEMPEGREP